MWKPQDVARAQGFRNAENVKIYVYVETKIHHAGKSVKAAICLRLGLPSTLIRHQNVAFQKRFFKAEDFEKAGFVL